MPRDFTGSQMMTITGMIDPLNPTPDMIDMRETAVSLSNQSRWNGYTNSFYSSAQHSTIMSYWCEDIYEGTNCKMAKAALLHDAGEAWIGEIVRPLKQTLSGIDAIESLIARMIFEDHGLDPDLWDCVEMEELDQIMINTEIRDLKPGYTPFQPELCIPDDMVTINPQMPDTAYMNFIMRYNALFPERKIAKPYMV